MKGTMVKFRGSRVHKFISKRYSILIVPHHLASSRNIELGIPFIFGFLGIWSLITVGGFFACLKGGELLFYLGEAKLLRAQMGVVAQEVYKMRELARGVSMLEKDLKFLLGQKDLGDISQMASGKLKGDMRSDTIAELSMGQISKSTMESMVEESNLFAQESKTILSWAGDFLLRQGDAARQEAARPSRWPVVGVLTSGYGIRLSPFHERQDDWGGEAHRGVDIANAQGTPVWAAADGVVRRAGWIAGYGRTVVLDHGFGYSSLYGHTSEILVSEGAYVHRGDTIAYMGTTGRSTGNHLHFEVWQHGRPVNPFRLVRRNDLANARESYAKRIPVVEPESAVNLIGSGVGGGALAN